MKYALLGGVLASALYVVYQALLLDAASPYLIVTYVATSLGALALSVVSPSWAVRIKWAWVALSLVVIYAIISGPLNYLRLQ